jgi:hypothetical protein
MIHDPKAILAAYDKFLPGSFVDIVDVESSALVCCGVVVGIGDGIAVRVPDGFYETTPQEESWKSIAKFDLYQFRHETADGRILQVQNRKEVG